MRYTTYMAPLAYPYLRRGERDQAFAVSPRRRDSLVQHTHSFGTKFLLNIPNAAMQAQLRMRKEKPAMMPGDRDTLNLANSTQERRSKRVVLTAKLR